MSKQGECLFCAIVDGEIPAKRIYENKHVVGFHDIHPQAPVHVLFVPRKHIATVNALGDDDAALAGQLLLAARDYAKAEGFADNGFRLVMNCNDDGGQTVYHLHLHLLAGRAMPAGFGG